MRRLFIAGTLQENIEISGADAHHLQKVMRAKAGDEILVVDSVGHVGRTCIAGFSEGRVVLHLEEVLEANTDSPLRLTLAQCLPKGDKMEFLVQKAVEMGAVRVQPLESEHVVVRLDAEKAEKKVERWQKIADEAAKQCGRTALLSVVPLKKLEHWLKEWKAAAGEDDLLLFCYEGEKQQSVREILQKKWKNITLLIGTEGGFSEAEARLVRACGGQSVTLGSRILRVETAALAAMTLVQYECGDFGNAR